MSVTQSWNMLLVPESFQDEVSINYQEALAIADKYLDDNEPVIELWKENPDCFGWHALACDIHDKHIFYNSYIEWHIVEKFYGFFSREEFNALFFKYSKFTAPKTKAGKLQMADVVITYGETPPHVLFQAIGSDAINHLPGFFGNFYIPRADIRNQMEAYNNFISGFNRTSLLSSGAQFYNAPCNNESDKEFVEETLNTLPRALKYADESECGLLGLVVTVG